MITVPQFLARETAKYRHRYNKLFGVLDLYPGWKRYERPEQKIPGHDHCFAVGPYLISRPYSMYDSVTRELLEFCERHELEFTIEGQSSWHPRTVTVQVVREGYRGEFWQRARAHGDAFEMSVGQSVHRRIHGQWLRVKEKSYWRKDGLESGIWVSDTRQSTHGVKGKGGGSPIEDILAVSSRYQADWED
jgi:hypothetical protein